MTHTNRAAEATNLRDKNEAFFKVNHPNIYKIITKHEFTRLTLNIDATTGHVDVFDGQQSIYNGDLDNAVTEEISSFKAMYAEGKTITTIAPPTKDSFPFHRYFSNRMRELVATTDGIANKHNHYQIPDFYPLIFFMGCWTGEHIRKFLHANTVLKAIIFEPDPEKFLLSLYITDWQELFEYAKSNDNEISITLGSNKNHDIADISNNVWNMFVNQCPSFPLMSLFYNHLGDTSFKPIINKVRKDMHIYLNQWGYYDDEINQLNNAFHNIASDIPSLPQDKSLKNQNIILVGAGPSLDQRIDEIKNNKNAIIVSCGSGLRPLVKQGIIPDYHVELESHMLTFEVLNRPEYAEVYKKTTLIAALQLPPNVFELFNKKYYFIKDSSALSYLFTQNREEIITGATPTCTNAGFAIFSHLNYKNIYLYGLDFGFIDKEKHHSESSIYYEEGNSDSFTNEVSSTFEKMVSVTSVYEKPILSVPMYCTSRRSLENCITSRTSTKELNIYNCSEGAKIEGAIHLSSASYIENINKNKNKKKKENITKGTTYSQVLRDRINDTHICLNDMCSQILEIIEIEKDKNSLIDNFRMCNKINKELMTSIQKTYGARFYLIRGTTWHILHTGMSVALSIEDTKLQENYLSEWKKTFTELMINIPIHFNNITKKEFPSKDDPWIHKDIAGNEKLFTE